MHVSLACAASAPQHCQDINLPACQGQQGQSDWVQMTRKTKRGQPADHSDKPMSHAHGTDIKMSGTISGPSICNNEALPDRLTLGRRLRSRCRLLLLLLLRAGLGRRGRVPSLPAAEPAGVHLHAQGMVQRDAALRCSLQHFLFVGIVGTFSFLVPESA